MFSSLVHVPARPMRPSGPVLVLLAVATAAFLGSAVHAYGHLWHRTGVARYLVQELRLTDLCLFTEARYTRHPSQADLHTAFQDHPLALEHFPSGALLGPPKHLTDHALVRPTALPD